MNGYPKTGVREPYLPINIEACKKRLTLFYKKTVKGEAIRTDRTERTKEKFKRLFGGAPTENEGTDPEFMRILQRFIFGEVSYEGSLDDKLRELITVTVLTVNQTLPQLKAHVGACLNTGLTPTEIREAVYRCAPFIGFPKTLNAIAAMNEVYASKGIELPLEDCGAVGIEHELVP